jgi:predicted nuclease of restriction endonuclease-like RecB superfamily
VRALRKMLGGGRSQRAKVARQARSLVLGHPALDATTRAARLAAAGSILDLDAATVESLLWADLAMERPVVLPSGRPHEAALVAAANLDRIERAVRRARELRLRVWDDAHEIVRMAARCGLIAKISRGAAGETVLDLAGPLSLFHATTVYGRALSALMPFLVEQRHFTLDLVCEYDGRAVEYHVEPPIALPPVRPSRRKPSIAERLADDLEKARRVVRRDPPPIAYGDALVFPDLVVDHDGEPYWIEIVGFSTLDYIEHKLMTS